MNHASWLDAWGRGLVVPPFLLLIQPFLRIGSELPTKEAGLHALFETTKAAYLSKGTLSLGKGRRGLSTADAVHLSGKGKGDRTCFSRPVRTYGSRGRSSW